jgi:hypothetical protein
MCGAVRYAIGGPLRPIIACHCVQCRNSSGHFVAATACSTVALTTDGPTKHWFQSSETAERGFCGRCGGNLLWRRIGSDGTSVRAGSIDGPTGLKIERHIVSHAKCDYYELPAGPAETVLGK